uniref:Uncharacterized protein n=1 Tax=Brassica oleracea var. oleracea TaxID=109376 RepID=A0A0D3DAS2_BRAOL
MEDLNTYAADCVVVSCCCNCLVLQLAIFIFLGLPQKLVKNTRKCYTKWGINRRRKRMGLGCECKEKIGVDSEWIKEIMSIEMEGFGCIEEVEKSLEEFSKNAREIDHKMGKFETFFNLDPPVKLAPRHDQTELVHIRPKVSVFAGERELRL